MNSYYTDWLRGIIPEAIEELAGLEAFRQAWQAFEGFTPRIEEVCRSCGREWRLTPINIREFVPYGDRGRLATRGNYVTFAWQCRPEEGACRWSDMPPAPKPLVRENAADLRKKEMLQEEYDRAERAILPAVRQIAAVQLSLLEGLQVFADISLSYLSEGGYAASWPSEWGDPCDPVVYLDRWGAINHIAKRQIEALREGGLIVAAQRNLYEFPKVVVGLRELTELEKNKVAQWLEDLSGLPLPAVPDDGWQGKRCPNCLAPWSEDSPIFGNKWQEEGPPQYDEFYCPKCLCLWAERDDVVLKIFLAGDGTVRERIEWAVQNTQRLIPGYWEKTLAQRAELSGSAAGSVYEGVDERQLEAMILSTTGWERYKHPAIAEGCSAFRAAIPGRLGVVDLRTLPPEGVITLDDRKGTGKVSATVEGVRGEVVDFTVLILGPEKNTDGVNEEVVYTFHPGDPIRPSQVQAEPGLHGKKITVQEALELGLVDGKNRLETIPS